MIILQIFGTFIALIILVALLMNIINAIGYMLGVEEKDTCPVCGTDRKYGCGH